jgi:hypothetical protein
MDVGHQRTRRKFYDLHSQKAGTGPSTPEENITTLGVGTQNEGEAEAEFRIDLCIVCITRGIQITGQEIVPSFLSPKRR